MCLANETYSHPFNYLNPLKYIYLGLPNAKSQHMTSFTSGSTLHITYKPNQLVFYIEHRHITTDSITFTFMFILYISTGFNKAQIVLLKCSIQV